MRSFVGKVLLGVFILFIVADVSVGATLDYPTLQSAVVKIRATKRSDPGAGTLIKIDGQRGYILTAYHVIQDAVDWGLQKVEVEFYREIGSFDGVIVSDWIAVKDDLAIVAVENVPVRRPMLIGDPEDLKIQDSVIAIGHPSGSSWSVTKGEVSNFENGYILFSGIAVDRGSSGGRLCLTIPPQFLARANRVIK